MSGVARAALIAALAIATSDGVPRRSIVAGAPVWSRAEALSRTRVRGPAHYIDGFAARRPDGSVTAVVENPAGTTAKLEVDRDSGELRWDGREIDYLPFPINYGLIPRTLSHDGDPLDVAVLGRAIERGAVLPVRPIAVIDAVDRGDPDPKIVAVPLGAEYRGFREVYDLDDLAHQYPGVRAQLDSWFTHYKDAPGQIRGWLDAAAAERLIDEAMRRYR